MVTGHKYKTFSEMATQSLLQKLLPMFTDAGLVTVLFIAVTGLATACAQETIDQHLEIFEFTSEFSMPRGKGFVEGLMASNGPQVRIALYWIEPAMFRDSIVNLSYSDFIFSENVVHYWICGATQPMIFRLSDPPCAPLLPGQPSKDSVIRSALAMVNRVRRQSEPNDIPLELGRFFQGARNQAKCTYQMQPNTEDSLILLDGSASDVQILNALTFGREYSKNTLDERTWAWSAQKAMNDQPVFNLMVNSS